MITPLPRHSRPQLLEEGRVRKATNDPAFWQAFPEFDSVHALKTRLEAYNNAGGCSTCAKHRNLRAIYSAFMAVLEHVDEQTLIRLKDYLGIESLMFLKDGKPVVV